MLTVTKLYGLPRTTILHYERDGLLNPSHRLGNGYRWYGDSEKERLEAITSYGASLASIKELPDRESSMPQTQIVKEHFNQLEKAIVQLRKRQTAIVARQQEALSVKEPMVTKNAG